MLLLPTTLLILSIQGEHKTDVWDLYTPLVILHFSNVNGYVIYMVSVYSAAIDQDTGIGCVI